MKLNCCTFIFQYCTLYVHTTFLTVGYLELPRYCPSTWTNSYAVSLPNSGLFKIPGQCSFLNPALFPRYGAKIPLYILYIYIYVGTAQQHYPTCVICRYCTVYPFLN